MEDDRGYAYNINQNLPKLANPSMRPPLVRIDIGSMISGARHVIAQ